MTAIIMFGVVVIIGLCAAAYVWEEFNAILSNKPRYDYASWFK